MCFHVSVITEKAKIAKRFKRAEPLQNNDFTPKKHFNGFNLPKLPIVKANAIEMYHWGLVPSWANESKSLNQWANSGLNAKVETLNEKPYFKDAFTQTAILACNGFYEWQHLPTGEKQLWFIKSKEDEICSIAVIYQISNKVSVESYKSFSLITTVANKPMAEVHNTKLRMPILLPKNAENNWLNAKNEDEIFEILKNPLPENKWETYPISNHFLNKDLDKLEIPKPIFLAKQQSLF